MIGVADDMDEEERKESVLKQDITVNSHPGQITVKKLVKIKHYT